MSVLSDRDRKKNANRPYRDGPDLWVSFKHSDRRGRDEERKAQEHDRIPKASRNAARKGSDHSANGALSEGRPSAIENAFKQAPTAVKPTEHRVRDDGNRHANESSC